MWPVITPVQPCSGLGPVQAARDETADFVILRIKKEFGSGLCFQVFNMVQTYINIFYFVQTVKVTGLA